MKRILLGSCEVEGLRQKLELDGPIPHRLFGLLVVEVRHAFWGGRRPPAQRKRCSIHRDCGGRRGVLGRRQCHRFASVTRECACLMLRRCCSLQRGGEFYPAKLSPVCLGISFAAARGHWVREHTTLHSTTNRAEHRGHRRSAVRRIALIQRDGRRGWRVRVCLRTTPRECA